MPCLAIIFSIVLQDQVIVANTHVSQAFILYRQHHQAGIVAQHPGLANPEISKIIGDHWRSSPHEVKNHWKGLAEVSYIYLRRICHEVNELTDLRKRRSGIKGSTRTIGISLEELDATPCQILQRQTAPTHHVV